MDSTVTVAITGARCSETVGAHIFPRRNFVLMERMFLKVGKSQSCQFELGQNFILFADRV